MKKFACFGRLRKIAISHYNLRQVRHSACLYTWDSSASTGGTFIKFYIRVFKQNVENFTFY